MKVLFSVYHTYGKGAGAELSWQEVQEDTEDNREEFLEEWAPTYSCEFNRNPPESFITGKVDYISFTKDYFDWDDPTGGYITVETYGEALEALETNFKEAVEALNKQFNGGNA